jgi:hypothetical protein
MRTLIRASVIALAVAAPLGLAVATPTKGPGHPNLAAAAKLVQQAFDRLEAAQKANEFELGGHAAKAKDLLKQANDEIKLAVGAADTRDKKTP